MGATCLNMIVLKPLIVNNGCSSTNSSTFFCRLRRLYIAVCSSSNFNARISFSISPSSSSSHQPLICRRNIRALSTAYSASTHADLSNLDPEITLFSDPPVFADEIRDENGEDREKLQWRSCSSANPDENGGGEVDLGRNEDDITLESVNRDADGVEQEGMEIRVAEREERFIRGDDILFPLDNKLFVANFTHEVDGHALAQIFSEAGAVEIAEVIYNRETGSNRCFGFVTMSTADEAEKAIQMFHGRNFCGRLLAVVKAVDKDVSLQRKKGFCLYVGNLPWEVDNCHLQKIFGRYGRVMDSRVMYHDGSGLSRGYGFVTMSSETESDNAISALDGESLLGRILKVSRALNKLSWQS